MRERLRAQTGVVLCSNVGFSLRAVFAKELRRSFPSSTVASSSVALFHHVSRYGLAPLLLAALVHDRATLLAALQSPHLDKVRFLQATSQAEFF